MSLHAKLYEIGWTSTIIQRRWWHPTPVLLPGQSQGRRSLVGCSPWGRKESGTTERLHFHFSALEKEMATHSCVLAWRIPGTGEPGELPSMGLHRVGHDWSDLAAAAAAALLKWRYLIEKRLQCTFWCSVAKSRLTLCNPKDWSTTGFPVLHYLPEFAQIHVHWVSDAI